MPRSLATRMLGALLVLVLATLPALAQPAPCDDCKRGDELIERYSLDPLRALADQLAGWTLDDPLSAAQYAKLIELRRAHPALARLGALEDDDLAAIATALCRGPLAACTVPTGRALRCLAERCAVQLPPDAHRVDLPELPARCQSYQRGKPPSALGVGFDWGTGWQRSQYPTDGRAWSFGIETRLRVTRRWSAVARVDRVAGRDEATDEDDNGLDDRSTGSITRLGVLGGPSIILDHARFEGAARFLRLDLLGGYIDTRSQAAESGPAAGFDIAYQLSIVRFGVRVVQGFGDARDATMVLGHIGFTAGSTPPYRDENDCREAEERSSRLALGFEVPLGGYGISKQLGYLATGLAIEGIWHVSPALDAMTRADLLVFPGDDRDRVIHQALLAGVRIDHGKRRGRSSKVGFFTTVLAGYTHGATLTNATTGSGPVGDLGLAWGRQGRDLAGYFRLHARFGIGPENLDYRALFLSAGFELRLDPERWRDRT